MGIKGQIISGSFDSIMMRQKKGETLEIGELLVSESENHKIILQVVNLMHSSQVSQSNIEYISGLKIEENADIELMDEHLRYYTVAELKSILAIENKTPMLNKKLAGFFSKVRSLEKDDINFLTIPKSPLYIGKLRSGSKIIDSDLYLDGENVLSHHILVAATTGRGKSNLTSCILWNILNHDYAGILVLDPHDEYYGRNKKGLKDHPQKEKVVYYTPFNVPQGASTLKINLSLLKPEHFKGALYLTDAQNDAIYTYYKKFKQDWIKHLLTGEEIIVNGKPIIHEATLSVLKRKLMTLLDINVKAEEMSCEGIFDEVAGASTINDICNSLEQAKAVIIDTSNFSGSLEILIGSMIATEAFNRYRKHKRSGALDTKPVITIILEEAPRVLGKDIVETAPNIFSSIAKEGRKFKVGLYAITQLPSLIPKDILANMNTKIILGIEMASERQAIIDSSAQDLSADSRNIASLDKGEALITSNFTKFATPVKIPFFLEMIEEGIKSNPKSTTSSKMTKKDYSDVIR